MSQRHNLSNILCCPTFCETTCCIQHWVGRIWNQPRCWQRACGYHWCVLLLTSLIKYLGFQGVLVVALFLPSLRCLSSRQCLCSVASSIFPAFNDAVTCCQRCLQTKDTEQQELSPLCLGKRENIAHYLIIHMFGIQMNSEQYTSHIACAQDNVFETDIQRFIYHLFMNKQKHIQLHLFLTKPVHRCRHPCPIYGLIHMKRELKRVPSPTYIYDQGKQEMRNSWE